MKMRLIVLIVLIALAGCASGKRELDPNYVHYQQAFDSYLVAMQTPRPLVQIEGHSDRPITIDARSFVVNQPSPDLPLPQQYRDYTAEATVAAWRDGIVGIGGPLISGIVTAYGGYNSRKTTEAIIGGVGGGVTISAAESAQVTWTGDVGAREWGVQTGGTNSGASHAVDNSLNPIANTSTSTDNSIANSNNPIDNSNQNNPVNPDPVVVDPVIVPAPDPVIVPAPDPVIVNPIIVPAPDPVIVNPVIVQPGM